MAASLHAPMCLVALLVLAAHVLVASAATGPAVTCGSSIKLAHVKTKVRLHSHEVSYSRGSQQQSVTGFPTPEDGQSYWTVHGPADKPCQPGDVFKKGNMVRLQHSMTRKWLHSHLFHSPLSGNQEVSAYGGDTTSDTGDVWVLQWSDKSTEWRKDTKIMLHHYDTRRYLASFDYAKFGQPISGHQEVCAVDAKDKNCEWQAAEGVYMPVPGSEDDHDEL